MNAYLGTVSTVDADARRVQVSLPHLRTLTKPLRCVSPFGLVAPLPAVGDEVLILAPHGHLTDAVCVGWVPTLDQVADAEDRPLVASTTGSVPTQVDPDQPIGDAQVTEVRVR